MKSREQIIKELTIDDYKMKSKYITHIILEGADGVGKTTLLVNLLKAYNYNYIVYDRGELSNFVYAKKYNRQFVSLQRGLPFLYVLLTASAKDIKQRLNNKNEDYKESIIDDQKEFVRCAKLMQNDFHIIIVDTSGLNPEQVCNKVKKQIDDYVQALPEDTIETNWNKMYRKACDKLGLSFKVRGNQPFINERMIMSESTTQAGVFETFGNTVDNADNFIFSLAYSDNIEQKRKTLDFAYIINSKIHRRHEIVDYYLEMIKANKTCLVSDKVANVIDNKLLVQIDRVFGDKFITELSQANATVYCARDLAYLELQTARLYEAILANQIVFVDELSDVNQKILSQMYDDNNLIELLTVTPETLCEKYDKIMNDQKLKQYILNRQKEWYFEKRRNAL